MFHGKECNRKIGAQREEEGGTFKSGSLINSLFEGGAFQSQ